MEAQRLEERVTPTAEGIHPEDHDTFNFDDGDEEFFRDMRDLENRMMPDPLYMDRQRDLDWVMRATLLDWVHSADQRFQLPPEAFFLAVNIIDRFLSCSAVRREQLQLVGAAALVVAGNYEKSGALSLQAMELHTVYMQPGKELMEVKHAILEALDYDLRWPGPTSFLLRISRVHGYDYLTTTLAHYLLELAAMEHRMICFPPSVVADGAYCMAQLMLYNGKFGDHHLHRWTATRFKLQSVIDLILRSCWSPSITVYSKYVREQYGSVALIVSVKLNAGFAFP